MNKELRICYRIDKSAGSKKTFKCIKVKSGSYTLPRDKYKAMQEKHRRKIAAQLHCDKELVVPITLNEYLDRNSEEETEEILKEYVEDLYQEFNQVARFEGKITMKDVEDILQLNKESEANKR